MLKRLIVGLVLGTVIGAALAAVLVQGLGIAVFSTPVIAYLAAAVTGAIAGLVAGKPIWSADAKIEGGLKAFFGVVLALGGMFALRQWAHLRVDLGALKAGAGELGQLPAASLPIIAAVLSAFFELDNTPPAEGAADAKKASPGSKKGAAGGKLRVADDEGVEGEALDEPAASKKKR